MGGVELQECGVDFDCSDKCYESQNKCNKPPEGYKFQPNKDETSDCEVDACFDDCYAELTCADFGGEGVPVPDGKVLKPSPNSNPCGAEIGSANCMTACFDKQKECG